MENSPFEAKHYPVRILPTFHPLQRNSAPCRSEVTALTCCQVQMRDNSLDKSRSETINHLQDKLNYWNLWIAGCAVFLCDFHREQAWERWTAKATNGVLPIKDEVLAKCRLIANSDTEKIYQERVHSLKGSNFWKENPNLQVWFENHWLKEHRVSASYVLGN